MARVSLCVASGFSVDLIVSMPCTPCSHFVPMQNQHEIQLRFKRFSKPGCVLLFKTLSECQLGHGSGGGECWRCGGKDTGFYRIWCACQNRQQI